MKVCEKCKKIFEDDMNFCPYCGEKYYDDKDAVAQAMSDLDALENSSIKEEQPVVSPVSRMQKQEDFREEKENNVLNKVLIVLISLLTVVLLAGGIMAVKNLLPSQPVQDESDKPTDPTPQDPEKPSQPEIPKPDNPETDTPQTPISDNIEDVVELKKKISKEDGSVKLEFFYESSIEGSITLKDQGTLNIGPLDLRKGEGSFYFLVSGNSDYTLLFEDKGNNKTYSYTLTKEEVQKNLKNKKDD